MSKVLAIARYEFLMQWRRRGVIVLFGFLLLSVIGLSLLTGAPSVAMMNDGVLQRLERANGESFAITLDPATGEEMSAPLDPRSVSSFADWMTNVEWWRVVNTIYVLTALGIGIQPLLIGLLPIFADVLPNDHVYRVAETVRALPVRTPAYLLGKVLGVWGGILVGSLVVAVLFGLYSLTRPYDGLTYALMWLAYVVPAGLLGAAISVLLGAFFKRRRTAILISVAAIPVVVLICASLLLTMYLPIFDRTVAQPPPPFLNAMATLAAGSLWQVVQFFAIPLLLFFFAWVWRDARDFAA